MLKILVRLLKLILFKMNLIFVIVALYVLEDDEVFYCQLFLVKQKSDNLDLSLSTHLVILKNSLRLSLHKLINEFAELFVLIRLANLKFYFDSRKSQILFMLVKLLSARLVYKRLVVLGSHFVFFRETQIYGLVSWVVNFQYRVKKLHFVESLQNSLRALQVAELHKSLELVCHQENFGDRTDLAEKLKDQFGIIQFQGNVLNQQNWRLNLSHVIRT